MNCLFQAVVLCTFQSAYHELILGFQQVHHLRGVEIRRIHERIPPMAYLSCKTGSQGEKEDSENICETGPWHCALFPYLTAAPGWQALFRLQI
jgi:hypothetical protein